LSDLEVGKPRFGWLIDGDPSTPLIGVALEDTGSAIELRIPWSNRANTGHIHRWFSSGIEYGDDPDRTRFSYAPPEHLWFHDVHGMVALVGAHAGSSSFLLTHGLGEGRIPVDYAVLDSGAGHYGAIHGLRSEFDGLTDWAGLRSLRQEAKFDDEGLLSDLTFTLRSPDPIPLMRRLNLQLRPHFWTNRSADGDLEVHETVIVESRVRRATPWADHLIAHGSVRDLLALCWWRLGRVRHQWVCVDSSPHRALDGSARGDRWSEVRTYRVLQGEAHRADRRPLFRFDDIGTQGFRRWSRLRHEYARGINPILATLNAANSGLEANLALSCIGLDGIGYQRALDSGISRARANQESQRTRFLRIASEVPYTHPVDVDEWAQRAADANNGIKHANRDMPDVLTMAETLRENCVMFRLWVAAKLHVSDATIQAAISADAEFQPLTMR